jgi:ribonuclease HI
VISRTTDDRRRWIATADGACRHHESATAAAILYTPAGRRAAWAVASLGCATSNEAEYIAILLAVHLARYHDVPALEVRSDSRLAIETIRGHTRAKTWRLAQLVAEIRTIAATHPAITWTAMPRHATREAHRLAAWAQAQMGCRRAPRWQPNGPTQPVFLFTAMPSHSTTSLDEARIGA